MKIRPLGDRVLLKRIEEQTKTAGGILIPDAAKEKPMEGQVVAVGPGKVSNEGHLREPEVKTGDIVLFGKYAGSEIKLDGTEYVIIREEEILGIVKN